MNRNLNPEEFSDQLFDTSEYTHAGPPRPEAESFPTDYPAPSWASRSGPVNNPIYDPDAPGPLSDDRSQPLDEHEEWVPTYEIGSDQTSVDMGAVEHLTEHGTGLHEPNIMVSRNYGKLGLWDGNHRLNAALRRGQLLTPATVIDYDKEYGWEG